MKLKNKKILGYWLISVVILWASFEYKIAFGNCHCTCTNGTTFSAFNSTVCNYLCSGYGNGSEQSCT